jgi:membrane fusion protein (multidrug efflux system)
MERSNNGSLNGHGRGAATVEEKPLTAAKISTVDEVQTAPPKEISPEVSRNPELEKEQLTTDNEQPVQPLPKKKNRKPLIFAVVGIAAITASVFGYRYWSYASTHEETDNATVAGHIHQVSSRINGTVSEVEVNDNQLVQKGQLLLKLDPRDLQMKALQAQAALDAAQREANAAQTSIRLAAQNAQAQTTQAQGNISDAQAGISAAQASVTEARAGIPAAQAAVAQANANLQRTQADYNRYQSLYSQGAIPRQQLDNAKAAYEVALAQRNSAQQGVQQAQAKLAQAIQGVSSAQAKLAQSRGGLQQATATGVQTDVNRAQYEAARAAIAQAEASLKDAQLQLSYTNITALSNGRVGRKSVEVGQRVQPGSPLLAIVEGDYWVSANFKETQLEDMKPGQEVEIKLDAFAHHTFTGRVDSISPASGSQFALLPPDNATGNFTKVVQRIPVKVTFDPQSIQGYESRITPGMSAVVSVEHEKGTK